MHTKDGPLRAPRAGRCAHQGRAAVHTKGRPLCASLGWLTRVGDTILLFLCQAIVSAKGPYLMGTSAYYCDAALYCMLESAKDLAGETLADYPQLRAVSTTEGGRSTRGGRRGGVAQPLSMTPPPSVCSSPFSTWTPWSPATRLPRFSRGATIIPSPTTNTSSSSMWHWGVPKAILYDCSVP